MKSTSTSLLLFLLLVLCGCQRRVSTPAVDVVSKDGQGLLTVSATGFGERQVNAEKDARRLALERLLYTGIPDVTVTDARLPLIPNSTSLSAAQKRAVERLIAPPASDRYFIGMSKDSDGAARASNLRKQQAFLFQINYDLLRRDLESQGIIRKFGL